MDNTQLEKNWPQISEKLLQDYPSLTASDLVYQIGKEAELLQRLQKKLKKNRSEIDYMLSLMG